MAVGKGNVRRYEILCRLPLLAGGKEFFADCLYWQVAKNSLPSAFTGRWQRAL